MFQVLVYLETGEQTEFETSAKEEEKEAIATVQFTHEERGRLFFSIGLLFEMPSVLASLSPIHVGEVEEEGEEGEKEEGSRVRACVRAHSCPIMSK